MKRTLLPLLLTFTLIACATAPAPSAPPTTPAPATATPALAADAAAPCNPGHSILNSVLWVQSSAEFRATSLQTYAAARRALDLALADPQWIGAEEDNASDPPQPPAIVTDLDETVLDNTPFEARVVQAGTTFDEATWKKWVEEAAAPAMPGAAEFLQYAASRGVTIFYVTNRDEDEGGGTRRNLVKLGLPYDVKHETLLLRQNRVSDKSPRRRAVAGKYRVLLLIGDDLNDFANTREASWEERDALITRTASWWGTRWFMIANPMYGSWERAAIGSGGSPCERVERKVQKLRP